VFTIPLLAENIRKFRTANNMTQTQLAQRINVSCQAISKWERGAAVPELDKLCLLSREFCVSLDELVGNMEDGKKIYELRDKYTFPGFGGTCLLLNEPDGTSLAEVRQFGKGAVLLLGATYYYSQFCQMDLLNFCLDTLGCARRVKTDCRTLAVTLFEKEEKAMAFLINNLPGTVTDSFAVTANGKEYILKDRTVPPFSVVSVPLQ
jgi:transcriptional regulator with XRE-family HTH domain